MQCFFIKDAKEKVSSNFLAKFTWRQHLRKPGIPVEYHKLEVSAKGHQVLDDIIMSILVIERMRTM
jgi:hypothetical protein